jgi:hypothetical protein
MKGLVLAAALVHRPLVSRSPSSWSAFPPHRCGSAAVFLWPGTRSLAIGPAILRYRVYDIDPLISRTVSYVFLTALLLGVYGGGVVGLR